MSDTKPGIVVYCKKCGKKNRAPVSAAGMHGVCAQCGVQMLIPAESEAEPTHEVPAPAAPAPAPVSPPQSQHSPTAVAAPSAAEPTPKVEHRPVPEAKPSVVYEPSPVVATPPVACMGDDVPFDGSLPELDAILRDLDDRVPSPGKPTCPDCGNVLSPKEESCPRCGRRRTR